MEDDHLREEDDVGPAEGAKGASALGEKEQQREGDEQGGNEAEHLGLRLERAKGREDDVAALRADVVHQFKEREMVAPLPEKVGEGDYDGDKAAEPEPAMAETSAERCKADADNESAEPEEDGVLVEDGDSCERSDGKPQRLTAGIGELRDEAGDGRPQGRVEGVHGRRGGRGRGGLGAIGVASEARNMAQRRPPS